MITSNVLQGINTHARECYPEEMCGYISNNEFVPVKNTHPNPVEHFRMDPTCLDKAEAIIHSHTYDCNSAIDMRTPSVDDVSQQRATGIPWFIVGVTERHISPPLNIEPDLDAPLLGRKFIHLTSDCYTLIRSYYKQELNITLPEFGRDYNWWEDDYEDGNPVSLYDKHFEAGGFYEVDKPQKHDLVIMRILSRVNNHGGVCLGDGNMIHHMVNRLSTKEPLHKWRKYATTYLRHKDVK